MKTEASLVILWALALGAWTIGCGVQPTTPDTPVVPARPLVDAPTARSYHSAIWTGTRMIVWGGKGSTFFNDGAAYDPTTDTWTAVSVTHAPTPRYGHAAVWTGSKMIVWGGHGLPYDSFNDGYTWFADGAAYDPTTDDWMPLNARDAPDWIGGSVVWTGSRMIVWGGWSQFDSSGRSSPLNVGRAYDPVTDTWTPIGLTEAPDPMAGQVAVWTGTRMIVWQGHRPFAGGGELIPGYVNARRGSSYNPMRDTWAPIKSRGAPPTYDFPSAVWAGSRMIVWGGYSDENILGEVSNRGGVFDPEQDTWSPTWTTGAPAPRSHHTAVSTGSKMIIWGGSDWGGKYADGGIYDPATDTWEPISAVGAASGRSYHTAVWTGTKLIVWGGTATNSGGVYDPATRTWTPTAIFRPPSR